ncbi:MAG: DUF3617 family protein [Betaproteobacteria bacterium]|nr:DUF3617 family protein [Betaproteobacteria bacterium]MBU6511280.1 DUF3617 family protein [Betaproteobacteria bacterium]MDE1954322.1 DUF3617 family protein [Betaproteobacteria bacterium]
MPFLTRLVRPAGLAAALLGASLLPGAAAVFAGPAQTLQPGLWDYALQSRRGDGPEMNLAQMLSAMPATARPQIEDQLRQQGMRLDAHGQLQICLDAQSVATGHPPLHLAGHCEVKWKHPDAADWSFRYACTAPSANGHGTLHIASPSSYRSDYQVSGPQGPVSGKAQAHWVAASCGGLPPMRDPN